MKPLKSILALIILFASSSGLAEQAEFTQDQFVSAIEKGADAKQVEEMLAKGADINKATPVGETLLMAAAFAGRPEVVQLLLERGADLHAKTSKGITALMAAAIAGKTEVIKLLLDKGMQVNEKDSAGSTALAKAAFSGKTEAVGLLLERGAFANATIDGVGNDRAYADHAPVLLMVTLKGTPEIVRMLLEHDADVNAKGRDGATPLMMAAARGDAGMVKLMLDKGADVNAKGPQNATPLMFAAVGGSLDSAEILLKHGADRTLKDSAGKTALDVAKLTHHLAVAKLLESEKLPLTGLTLGGQDNMLQAIMDGADAKQVAEMLAQGADANKPDEKGWPPLLFATTKGNLEVVRLLLDKGADVNVKSPRGETALFVAVMNHATELTQLLVDKGADVNARQPDGNTLLNSAIYEYKTELVKLLLSKGADVNAKNQKDETALWMALRVSPQPEITKLLVDKGADPSISVGGTPVLFPAAEFAPLAIVRSMLDKGANANAKGRDGRTALQYIAAYADRVEVLELLLNRGAVDVQTEDGWTALMTAAEMGNLRAVELLLNHGADRNIKNVNGMTALDFAKKSTREHNREVVKLLEGTRSPI